MNKKILGLDIGVSSVGIAVVEENNDQKEIKELAVRIVPEDPDFHGKFYSGNTASKNLARTEKRGSRRNNQRFKIRRDKLYAVLKENKMFPNEKLFDLGARELYGLRAKAVGEVISLEELGRVLILLNQRRGFLSNRKSNTKEENSTEYKKQITLLEESLGNKTIGEKLYEELSEVDNPYEVLLRERTYLRASYIEEFDRIWECQKQFYNTVLTGGSNEDENQGTLYDTIRNRIIFYQRPLKSQKGLVSDCPFEKYHKAVTKSSPYFEIFRIWQKLNDLSWKLSIGEKLTPSEEQKQILFEKLFYGKDLNSSYKLTVSKIKGVLGYGKNDKIYLSHTELDGSRTYSMLKNALQKAGVENPEQYLFFNLDKNDEKGGLFELWHITYSLPTNKEVVNTLQNRFHFSKEQAEYIANEVGYPSDYGNVSTKAIRKLLPHLQKGLGYSEACDVVGYDHSGYKTELKLTDKLKPVPQNSLRNPVVEQVLNQVVNMVNLAIEKHGKFDEIRVELARELRNSAKKRKEITGNNSKNKKENEKIRQRLKEEYDFKIVNGRDVKRYILWQETNKQCLYCNNNISVAEFKSGQAEIEHILPKSRSFNNSMNNYILAHKRCNSGTDGKNQMTAYDFMNSKGEDALNQYLNKVNDLYKDGKGNINKLKFENLLCKGMDIPDDFVERMKKDSQYIAKETVKILKGICKDTYTTTGQITDFLRDKWELKNVLQEAMLPVYKKIGQTEIREHKDGNGGIKSYEAIKEWSKRDDHRHHAVDALICALTDQKIIFKLNNLNKIYQDHKDGLTFKEFEQYKKDYEDGLTLKSFADLSDNWFDKPIEDLREQTKKHLDEIFVSFKKSNSKVLTKNINEPKNGKPKTVWTPRGRLHEETVMGRVKRIAEKPVKLNSRFFQLDVVANPEIKQLLKEHLKAFDNDARMAFSAGSLKKQPLLYKGKPLTAVKVYEEVCTKRVKVDENIRAPQIKKIIDNKVKSILENRILENEGNIKKAFSNLSENPLWLNEAKRIQIKSVTVADESKVEKVREGYVASGNNHHALIYKDEEGKYYDKVISFWEAVNIGMQNIEETGKPYPIINRNNDPVLGKFQFSMQINDLFVFDLKHNQNPQEGNELDFFNPENRKTISKRLFRMQRLSKSSVGQFIIDFRHHLETTVNRNEKELKGITWEKISKNDDLDRLTKIKINHLGDIVKIGE
ncbi:type II CRISPR RNA-guided endonuclease Cas9 [Leptobacterium sp. I13]|uniref:type II CRISPR RNA-guided endonuclease Cas9 n=1 Tax=Leptobacterium meishanense TaxID=3128904 RepID=UPI0030EBF9CB